MITVRPAAEADASVLRKIAVAAYQHYVPRIGRPPAPMTADYAAAARRGQAWLAAEDGEAAGFIILIPQPGHLLLENVAVLPAAQDRGIGARLLAAAVLAPAGYRDPDPGEAGFAASGECLTTFGRDAWFGSGASTAARVFSSRDGGLTWRVATTPIVAGATAGVFALAFRTPLAGVAVGGDFANPTAATRVAALSFLGSPWFSPVSGPAGYRSGVTWVPRTLATLVAVGLTGSDASFDGGLTWHTFDTGQFDTVSCAPDGSCWASGDLGRVAILQQ